MTNTTTNTKSCILAGKVFRLIFFQFSFLTRWFGTKSLTVFQLENTLVWQKYLSQLPITTWYNEVRGRSNIEHMRGVGMITDREQTDQRGGGADCKSIGL